MEISENIRCPNCGQPDEILIDTSEGSARWITDCTVCCRPMEIRVECEPGEILSLQVEPSG